MPTNGLIFPSPSRARLGTLSPRMLAILPMVSLSGSNSPYLAALGIAPMPALSRTIQMIRRNTVSRVTWEFDAENACECLLCFAETRVPLSAPEDRGDYGR